MEYAERPGALESDRAGEIVLDGTLPHTIPNLSIQRRESGDDYHRVVAVLNDRWRVIECHDGIQWILQRRNRAKTVSSGDWRGKGYCRTRDALIRCASVYCGEIAPDAVAVLASLPERTELSDDNHALRWIAARCRVSRAMARIIAENAGIGGRRSQ
jgi:hypothetical protein